MKILIAEDDVSLRRVLTAMLQKNNYCEDAVDNGADALEYLLHGCGLPRRKNRCPSQCQYRYHLDADR